MLYGAGVNLLVGYTGLVPFWRLGVFRLRHLCRRHSDAAPYIGNEIEALIFAVLFSLVLAAVLALIILRRRGLHFSLASTLAFSQIAFEVAFKWTDLTGGENGLQRVPRPLVGRRSGRSTPSPSRRSPLGMWVALAHRPCAIRPHRCRALRDNEQRARSLWVTTRSASSSRRSSSWAASSASPARLLALMLHGAYADNLGWQHAGDSHCR